MLPPHFVLIGIFINSFGSVSYILNTLKGRIKPNKVSYFIWSIAPLVAFSAQTAQGVGIQSLQTLTVSLFPLSIFIASFFNKKAYWKVTIFDLSCGALSLVGLLLWYGTQVSNIAIFFSILAEGLGTLPTVIKSYKYPETEIAWPWLASFIGGLLTLLTIKTWGFEQYGFPLFYSIEMFIIYLFVEFKIGKK